jgi:hypothetical protein
VVLLDVICLVVALVAVAFAVIALVRARAAEEQAAAAASVIARAEANAQAAAAGLQQLEVKVAQGRQDAVNAAQEAAKAAQAAASAQAAAAASRREAEAASDKAAHAEAEAARIEASTATASLPVAVASSREQAAGRASVQRAEDHDIADGDTGETERVVQVSWRLERVRNSTWALRNTGLAKARDALLSDATVPPKFVRPDEVIPRDVDRDDVLQFRVMVGRGTPPPRIRVTWREGAGSPAYSREFTVLTGS